MSYTANLETAITYHTTGLDDRALEMLDTAMNARNGENPAYLKILSMLAKINLTRSQGEAAWDHVKQGLALKEDHVDLLFLRVLILMDMQQYDEMLSTLIKYILALVSPQVKPGEVNYMYEYTGEGALSSLFKTLIPTAYVNSITHDQSLEIIRKLVNKVNHPVLSQAYEIMQEIDNKRTDASNEQEKVTEK